MHCYRILCWVAFLVFLLAFVSDETVEGSYHVGGYGKHRSYGYKPKKKSYGYGYKKKSYKPRKKKFSSRKKHGYFG